MVIDSEYPFYEPTSDSIMVPGPGTTFRNLHLTLILYNSKPNAKNCCSCHQETNTKQETNIGPVNRASATKMVDMASIPNRVEPKTTKLVFTVSLFKVQH